ncbi:hypothetical protein PHYSODRAFT_403509, partial [Phytophthora sojae]
VYQRARNETFAAKVSDYVGLDIGAQCSASWWGAQCDRPCSAQNCVSATSVSSRSFSTKIAANDTDKDEAPEVVTNYVYDVPEKKSKPKTPGSDYDDHDDQEDDDFDHELEDEEESEEDAFELRPFMSEDEDEMAYFAHRMGGPDFKLLRRHVLHPHGRIRSIWDTITLFLTT